MAKRESAKIMCELLINELQRLKNVKKKKRVWVRDWIKKRNTLGATNNICRELSLEDQGGYRNFFRMDPNLHLYLFNKIKLTIQKKDTNMRLAIPAECKLDVTLRFLATGDSFSSLQYLFRIPKNTISTFIPEVLDAIYSALLDFLKVCSLKTLIV